MLRIEVTPSDVAASRFAISPLGEAMLALRVVSGHQPAGALLPWVHRVRPRYPALRREQPAVDALVALFRPRGYNCDFVKPPPARAGLSFDDELGMVRGTPRERARAEIARNLDGHRPPPASALKIFDSPDVVDRLADAIEATWHSLVAPDWPVIRAVLERDLIQRAGLLVTFGWAAALSGLDRRVRWTSDTRSGVIEVRWWQDEHHRLDGRGLLLVPTAFGKLIPYLEPPWPYALVYPARGVADLIAPGSTGPHPGDPADPLQRLVGGSRAAILRSLDVPATTTQLTHRLGMSLGAAGDHLAVLRAAGLVERVRTGRAVQYHRSAVGEALVAR